MIRRNALWNCWGRTNPTPQRNTATCASRGKQQKTMSNTWVSVSMSLKQNLSQKNILAIHHGVKKKGTRSFTAMSTCFVKGKKGFRQRSDPEHPNENARWQIDSHRIICHLCEKEVENNIFAEHLGKSLFYNRKEQYSLRLYLSHVLRFLSPHIKGENTFHHQTCELTSPKKKDEVAPKENELKKHKTWSCYWCQDNLPAEDYVKHMGESFNNIFSFDHVLYNSKFKTIQKLKIFLYSFIFFSFHTPCITSRNGLRQRACRLARTETK